MKHLRWRPIAAVLVLVVTALVFERYFTTHPEVRHQLSHTSPEVLLGLLGLYTLSIGALGFATLATLRLCKLHIHTKESLLLTAYSAVINFFGPLQSGPALRAVYLKKKYNLNLKTFTIASLGYLLLWGIYSGLFLLSGLLKWWLVPLSLLGVVVLYTALKSRWMSPWLKHLDLRNWYYLAAATLAQIACVTIIYFVELHTVEPGTTLHQAIIYTGAANLALYVSLTPGAIGFRESFLLFSERLHHIHASTIVAANILDRSVYIVLLLILAALISLTHARRQLQTVVKNATSSK